MSLILSSALLDDIVNAQAGPPQTPSGATFPGPPQPPSGPGYPQPPPIGTNNIYSYLFIYVTCGLLKTVLTLIIPKT